MEQEEAIKELKTLIKPLDSVYTTVTKVSRSGMSRRIRVFIMKKNEPMEITHLVAPALELKRNEYGLNVSGCGMDMGFWVVYNLGSRMYPKGDGKTITGRNGSTEPDNDGGYLLIARWFNGKKRI